MLNVRSSACTASARARPRAHPPAPRAPLPLQEWYYAVPPITRAYVTGAIVVTGSCTLELVSPFSLYFNLRLVFVKLQLWRLVTNFFFFGALGVDFLFHMFFLARCAPPPPCAHAPRPCPAHPA